MHDIRLRGARTHNLKGLSLDLRPGELVALTGPSGAGKSSLAMDTLYAEGQRRFVESFSPYARQFLERLERPPIDSLDPIAATVAVDRRAPVKSSRSTLATMADLEPYLAALFAKESLPVCPTCGVLAKETTAEEAVGAVLLATKDKARAIVTYALHAESTEHFLELREGLIKDGYRRLTLGERVVDLDEARPSEVLAPGADPRVIIDRVSVAQSESRRIQQAIESAWQRGHGRARVAIEGRSAIDVARGLVCPTCGRSFEPPRPALFSYNSPLGACAECKGFGRIIAVDWDKVIPDHGKSIDKGAIKAWNGASAEWERGVLGKYCKRHGIPTDVAWSSLTDAQREAVLAGEGSWKGGKYPGVRAWFKWLETRTYKMHVRVFLARYREYSLCKACNGARLNDTARSYRVAGLDIGGWHALTVADAKQLAASLSPRDAQGRLAQSELAARLGYLDTVGLGYLTLDRQSRTLSGGEAQRAGLTTALGARLTGALFVLDEPTVGLHAADVPKLATAMRELASAGNAVLVIEHERSVIESCDRAIELGPGAGKHGGSLLFDGAPGELAKRKETPTGRAWARRDAKGRAPRTPKGKPIEIRGASEHNLKNVDVDVPLGVVCAITGPSGSGKSTLAHDILYRGALRAMGDTSEQKPGAFTSLKGTQALTGAVLVDQSPLGRTARGNPATYTKAWDRVRARFAAEGASAQRGLTTAHFSFNVAGAGRCEACSGEGYETIEMQFLADVSLLCAVCQGKRFKPEVLDVKHKGKSVADVLAMTIEEALALFDSPDDDDPVFRRALEPCVRVGLGYLPLGQPLSTLSGGEAQRLKLARALAEKAKGTLFVLDEPSAGLHPEDTRHVIAAMHELVTDGASVVIVEHDLDVIRAADWVIDLGPGGGPNGGSLVFSGPVSELLESGTKTGAALGRPSKAAARRARMTPHDPAITVSHAREHNLKDVSVRIPHGKLCVVTGPSGSGKSSLAFDVVFAEGQRRFMETLTPYARQFLPTLPRPDVDRVTGVPPSIALEQRTTRAGANSTVATVTEVAHYLRLLYAKLGELHCPECDSVVEPSSPDDLYERLTTNASSPKKTVYSPAVRARKGTYLDLLTSAARAGVQTARVDGAIVAIDPPPRLTKSKEHTIDLIVHYGALSSLDRTTFDKALGWGNGALRISDSPPTAAPHASERIVSTARACPSCGTGVPELDPRWFSFNTKQGQCGACEGSGVRGGPAAASEGETARCPECEGTRLSAVPRKVKLFGESYAALTARDVKGVLALASAWRFTGKGKLIADAPQKELVRRLSFALEVGLGYLALDRAASTLSGGEMQRLRLSAQLGSGLTGALYVLDEPTIGLHPRDTHRLITNLRALTESGSTVLVVEHDADTIRAADWVIDLGPSGGRSGGHVVVDGPADRVLASEKGPTAIALRDPVRAWRTALPMADRFLSLTGAREHNLKNVTFRVPVGRMTVVAGVSGSGKSTLVRRVFYPALRKALGLVADAPGAHDKLTGAQYVRRALAVDQSPIGRTPRSVPATFLGIWDEIRKLFASLPESKVRGYTAARFSFNTKGAGEAVAKGKKKKKKNDGAAGGRCPACEGQGSIVSEMAFLPDVVSTCETCRGARFEPSTLDVKYAGLSIGDVLHLSAEEAAEVFAAHQKIHRPLATLRDLGVGYLQIGQGSHTLSGGEAQRLKLAAELTAGLAHEPTVYVLDEPTTGLHLTDARRLVTVLDRLVARGDTLVIVEHHPDVIASADWVVELGPEGGSAGGRVVYEGDAKRLSAAKTPTGKFLHGAAARA